MVEGSVQRQDIGWAVKQLWNKLRVCRAGWDDKDVYLYLEPQVYTDGEVTFPCVYIRTVSRDRVPWLCLQMDLLATDWEIAK